MSPARPDSHTPHRPIRIEKGPWDLFGVLVGDRARAEVVRQFVAWYIRKPGAKLPDRPTVDAVEAAKVELARREAERQAAQAADES